MSRVSVLSNDPRVIGSARALGETVVFSDPALAVERVAGTDLAVIELELGGFSAVRELRADPSTRDVRVVMLCVREADRWLCRQAGADQVLVKPLEDPSRLIEAALAAASGPRS